MKKVLIVISLFSLSLNLTTAQIIDNLTLELNLGRFSPETGIFSSGYYPNEFTYINGFNIGYSNSEKWEYYVGVRKINSVINSGDLYSFESSLKNGMEYRLGARVSPKNDKKVFLSYGLELFGEFSNHRGTYWVDYPPTYEINHRRSYIGIAPALTLNIKLVDRVSFFIESRYRYGRVNLMQQESTKRDYELFRSREYWSGTFDLMNSIGVKFEL
ncbi:hypothetical protein [Phaeodactylibacter xiamenensis]|uniref:hypothetical protein n=1 Tax=Phaeodactylibacter xiamenensis TaxID=1524460 RepID=UPI003CCC0766